MTVRSFSFFAVTFVTVLCLWRPFPLLKYLYLSAFSFNVKSLHNVGTVSSVTLEALAAFIPHTLIKNTFHALSPKQQFPKQSISTIKSAKFESDLKKIMTL